MGKYSEIIGSFIRTDDYPLEANYYFNTEKDLIDFYNEPINKVTLHKGLLKIVGNLDLYWVSEQDGELYFKKLISKDSLETISDIKQNVESINEDKEVIKEIIDTLNSSIDNVYKLVYKIIGGQEEDTSLFLETLPYNSILSISNTLETLFTDLDNTKQEIIGDVSEEYSSLEKIETIIKELVSTYKHKIYNLQTELDLTQVGVGLSGDGSFNSDYETYYLQNATSVMNALKILDRMMKKLIDKLSLVVNDAYYNAENEELVIEFKTAEDKDNIVKIPVSELIEEWEVSNSNTIILHKERNINGKDILSANVKVSSTPSNILECKEDGLYAKQPIIDLDYTSGALEFSIDGNVVKTILLADKVLVTPVISSTWTILNNAGEEVSIPGINLNSNSITLENGYKANYSGTFKWTHSNTKKDPESVTGSFGTTLPASNVSSNVFTLSNISLYTTFLVTLLSLKKGFMVSGSSVVTASGNDTTKATATISFNSRRYYGTTVDPNILDITLLVNTELTTSKSLTLTNFSTENEEYLCYAYPTSFGKLSSVMQNNTIPVLEAFRDPKIISITNSAGKVIDYYVYVSNNKGAFTNVELKFS